MGDELANLLKIFKRVEKDGGQATLSVSTNAGKTTIKLELTSSLSKPAPSLPSSSASGGRRRRHRGPAKKEKAKVTRARAKMGVGRQKFLRVAKPVFFNKSYICEYFFSP